MIILIMRGTEYECEIRNNFVSVIIDPYMLMAWPLMFIALLLSSRSQRTVLGDLSPWWRGALAFIIDFFCIFSFLMVPASFLLLTSEIGGFPPPWAIEGAITGYFSFIYMPAAFFVLILFWTGIGLSLDPRVTTPGVIITGIHIEVGHNVALWRLMLFGVFSYYGLFIPLFKIFSFGTSAKVYLCKT